MEWMNTLGVESSQESVKLLQETQDPLVLGLMAVAAVLVAPVCEEVVFRGYLYPAAKRFAGPWVAGGRPRCSSPPPTAASFAAAAVRLRGAARAGLRNHRLDLGTHRHALLLQRRHRRHQHCRPAIRHRTPRLTVNTLATSARTP